MEDISTRDTSIYPPGISPAPLAKLAGMLSAMSNVCPPRLALKLPPFTSWSLHVKVVSQVNLAYIGIVEQ